MENLPTGRNNLYIGNLHPKVTEPLLRDIFQTIAPVGQVKILHDKNNSGMNYGFVEYHEHTAAEYALNSLDGREIFGVAIKVNWAVQSSSKSSEDAHHIFIGDLSNEVNDQVLYQAFQAFGAITEARVMWDPNTGKTRGYGFVSFRERADAEQAISRMNGEFLGSRSIRCNWATQRTSDTEKSSSATGLSYEAVLAQSPPFNTTVYVGNLAPETTQQQLYPLFQNYGYILEVRMQAEKGYCFFKYDSHEGAGAAIFKLNGEMVNGRQLKCSWGKEKSNSQAGSHAGQAGMPPQMMYGGNMPPNSFPPVYANQGYYQMNPNQQQGYSYDYYQGQYDYPPQQYNNYQQ